MSARLCLGPGIRMTTLCRCSRLVLAPEFITVRLENTSGRLLTFIGCCIASLCHHFSMDASFGSHMLGSNCQALYVSWCQCVSDK